jgi:hypothetical protein
MTRKFFLSLMSGPALALLLLPATPAEAGRIHNREKRQQARIAQGVASGQLTAGETARLEGREARLHRDVRAMRTANGGPLTPGERARVERRQDRLSRSIYRQKHDARTR